MMYIWASITRASPSINPGIFWTAAAVMRLQKLHHARWLTCDVQGVWTFPPDGESSAFPSRSLPKRRRRPAFFTICFSRTKLIKVSFHTLIDAFLLGKFMSLWVCVLCPYYHTVSGFSPVLGVFLDEGDYMFSLNVRGYFLHYNTVCLFSTTCWKVLDLFWVVVPRNAVQQPCKLAETHIQCRTLEDRSTETFKQLPKVLFASKKNSCKKWIMMLLG